MFSLDDTNFTELFLDPGLDHLGVAIFFYEYDIVKSISAFTIHTKSYYLPLDIDVTEHGHRRERMLALADAIRKLIKLYNPATICTETPFFNRLSPFSFASLSELLGYIRATAFNIDPHIAFKGLAPQAIKQELGASGIKGKDIIKEKLCALPDLMDKLTVDMDKLDDNGIDAIAIGYAYNQRLRRGDTDAIKSF